MPTSQQLVTGPACCHGWVAQLCLLLLPVELVVLYGWGVQLCVCSKAVDASVVVTSGGW